MSGDALKHALKSDRKLIIKRVNLGDSAYEPGAAPTSRSAASLVSSWGGFGGRDVVDVAAPALLSSPFHGVHSSHPESSLSAREEDAVSYRFISPRRMSFRKPPPLSTPA